MKNCQWQLRQTTIVSFVKSIWGKKNSVEVDEEATATGRCWHGRYEIEDFDFEPSSCSRFIGRPDTAASGRGFFSPSRVSHSRLKWNFTPPVRYRSFSSYPHRKKKICGQRDALRRHTNLEYPRAAASRHPRHQNFPTCIFPANPSSRFVSSGIFFFNDPHGEKKDRVNYMWNK